VFRLTQKPGNIGFDARGNLKLFDFGLARELKESWKNDDDTYNLTGLTGSPRYMAPEVAKSEPYNLSADVFSFGIIFWQVMSLDTPFAKFDSEQHHEVVVERGYRPACSKAWPKEWKILMRESWSPRIEVRPTFEKIHRSLCDEIVKLSSDNKLKNDVSGISNVTIK